MKTLLGAIIFIADVYALYHIITSSAPTLNKVLWSLAVLILPVLGFIAWYFAGPRGGTA
ncbi:PLD nuclease N-terminal domain-containing protein [Palleronia caenipelagi]|uniref:PLDc_N domain-containing protein n=1 Tax=Palleronia caenipelagi TaxID=2489174 RepID=A0A547Q5R6_9RHOB|nr:PLD nuclease N-terminal domain-containing protein [Palleronia caenipelagi]TRD21732.1 PLDc_N domain-containing protein [Palleronia caenipelagi]